MQSKLIKWLIVLGCGLLVALIPRPEGVTREAWTLLAIFVATIGFDRAEGRVLFHRSSLFR